ncbi:Tat pathway signal sequence domain protein [Kitasatospora sp. LaBMicrA B282]|uniref:Tat pathway signal sequence domain protein n=1 Tax=Kitasatospora sp. LaBMicrA B282 TaxID=3420949 RepID=UPI003D0F3497
MRITNLLAVMAAATSLAVSGAAPAFAQGPNDGPAILTLGGPAGTAVPVGDVLSGTLVPGTFQLTIDGFLGVTCTSSSGSATVTSNPAAPGTVTASLNGAPAPGGCTGIPGVSLQSVDLGQFNASASDTGSPQSFPVRATVTVSTLLGPISCTYQTAVAASLDRASQSLAITAQSSGVSDNPVVCPASASLSATYGSFTDTSRPGNPSVYVN